MRTAPDCARFIVAANNHSKNKYKEGFIDSRDTSNVFSKFHCRDVAVLRDVTMLERAPNHVPISRHQRLDYSCTGVLLRTRTKLITI